MSENISAAKEWGIEDGYHDVFGHWHATSPQTLEQLIAALSRGGPAAPHSSSDQMPAKDGTGFSRAFQGDGRRVWGIAVALYALRSRSNWGHGDFGDLARLIEIAAGRGASAIGLNPLHALFPDRAWQASPYAPNSRLFLNPLYIDVAAIQEFPGIEAAGIGGDIATARAPDLIDHAAVARAKLAGLGAAHARFASSAAAGRRADFEAYRKEQGDALLRFACFEVLRRQYEGTPWPQWPQPWRNPDSATLRGYREANAGACEFHEFTQWVADRQLQACKETAHRHGMSIGLYVDLAIGIDPMGADAWSQQDAVLADLSVGAPPDEFNPAGQDWGLAPFNPRTMTANDFEPIRRLMRASMRHAGALRIDHVLGLNRMFLIPHGAGAANGAYVRYPFKDSLRVVAEESNRARCIVIGEDLGTVPEGFRDTLARWGLWTYKVMLFEREQDGRFRPPDQYPAEALATFNTHDLPSFRGWMTNQDLKTKWAIGIDPGENDEARHYSREALRSILNEHAPHDLPEEFVAVARFLAATPSRLVVVALDDILDVVEQINIPGTVDQHPNWRRKLPLDVEGLSLHDGFARVAEAFAKAGRGHL
jgi:4-alpha-glucanotransferase